MAGEARGLAKLTMNALDALIQDAKLALDTIENANSNAFRAAAATWLAAIAGQLQNELTNQP